MRDRKDTREYRKREATRASEREREGQTDRDVKRKREKKRKEVAARERKIGSVGDEEEKRRATRFYLAIL